MFCFLPLPLEQKSATGLPVHVNGYFSISQNRRHLKWPTAGHRVQSDKVKLDVWLLWHKFQRAYVIMNYLSSLASAFFVVHVWTALINTHHIIEVSRLTSFAHVPLVLASQILGQSDLYFPNGSHFPCVPLLPTWLSLKPLYLAQWCISTWATQKEFW